MSLDDLQPCQATCNMVNVCQMSGVYKSDTEGGKGVSRHVLSRFVWNLLSPTCLVQCITVAHIFAYVCVNKIATCGIFEKVTYNCIYICIEY